MATTYGVAMNVLTWPRYAKPLAIKDSECVRIEHFLFNESRCQEDVTELDLVRFATRAAGQPHKRAKRWHRVASHYAPN